MFTIGDAESDTVNEKNKKHSAYYYNKNMSKIIINILYQHVHSMTQI